MDQPNYITPGGYSALSTEYRALLGEERPKLVEVISWAAGNGDPRSGSVDMVDWIEAIPIYETKNYVQRVLENAVVYDLMNPQHSRSQGTNRMSWYLGKSRPG